MSKVDVETGWAIVTKPGTSWDKQIYPTKEAAEQTAKSCMSGGYSIKPARRVWYFRKGNNRSNGHIKDDFIIDP